VENLAVHHLSPPPEKYWSMMAYNNAKLCNVLFAQELAQVSPHQIRLKLGQLNSTCQPFFFVFLLHHGCQWIPILINNTEFAYILRRYIYIAPKPSADIQ